MNRGETMPRLSLLLVAIVGLLCGAIVAPAVAAQDAATPAGAAGAAECQVERRPIEELKQLVGTPGAAEGTASTNPLASGTPTNGEPADQATVDAVTATYGTLVACLNSGDYLRVYALYTDDYLQRTLGHGQLDFAQLEATPVAPTQGPTKLVAVRDVRTLPDDRVSAQIETSDPTGGNVVFDAVLVPVDNRYLINAEEPLVTAAGTPAAAPQGQATAAAQAQAPTTVEITANDIFFDPKEVTIPANTDVTIELPNKGAAMHNFSIDKLGISVDLPPGQTEQTVVNAPAGTYEYYCNVPGHRQAGMVGKLIVQ
jgi:plastocyanin